MVIKSLTQIRFHKGANMIYSFLLSALATFSVSMYASPLNATENTNSPTQSASIPATSSPITRGTKPEASILNFSNWHEYMPESMLKDFERETGIKVNYRNYASNEELENKVKLKSDVDDLVVPSLNYGKTQAKLGYYQPLNKQWLPNYKNLDAEFLKTMEPSDPGNKFFVPWAWGHTTVFANKTRITKALGDLAYPRNELDLVFNPTYTAKLKSCGIAYIDSPSEIIPLAMIYMGIEPYSEDPANYKKAKELLKRVRKDIRIFSPNINEVIAKDKVCVAIAWSGSIGSSIIALKKAGNKDELAGLLPESGTMMFVDSLAIPVNAKHPQNAHAFINFYLKAQNSARMTNDRHYPNGNRAAVEYVNPVMKKDPLIFPPSEFFAKLVPSNSYASNARWAMMQEYISFAFQIDLK
jgi:putrescine transport system substrate-binding protein